VSQLAEDLCANEKELWRGKPARIPFILSALWGPQFPFGLVFSGFSVFWMILASQAGGPFWLFGLPFFFVGLGVSFGASVRRLLAFRNAEYLITDKRVTTKTGAIGLNTEYLDLDKVQETSVEVGFFDKVFGTGKVCATSSSGYSFVIDCVKEPYDVKEILQAAIRNTVSYCGKCDGVIPAGVAVCPYCGNVVAR